MRARRFDDRLACSVFLQVRHATPILLAQAVAALAIVLRDTQLTFPLQRSRGGRGELYLPVFAQVLHPARHRVEQARLGQGELSVAVRSTLSEYPPPRAGSAFPR
jgi:hypothetical protein